MFKLHYLLFAIQTNRKSHNIGRFYKYGLAFRSDRECGTSQAEHI